MFEVAGAVISLMDMKTMFEKLSDKIPGLTTGRLMCSDGVEFPMRNFDRRNDYESWTTGLVLKLIGLD